MKGYNENLSIIAIGQLDSNNNKMQQIYAGNPQKRFMLCSTTFEKGDFYISEAEKQGIIAKESNVCVRDVPCKHVLDNIYFKKTVSALLFNPNHADSIIVPAEILRQMIEAYGIATKPDGYSDD